MHAAPTSAAREVDWDARKQELLTVLDRYRRQRRQLGLHRARQRWQGQYLSGDTHVAVGVEPTVRHFDHVRPDADRPAQHRESEAAWGRLHAVEFSPNPLVRAKLNRIGLTEVGDIFVAGARRHLYHPGARGRAIQRAALDRLGRELAERVWRACRVAAQDNILTRRWLEEFGGLLGLRVNDLLRGAYGIERRHLLPYNYPSDEELRRVGVNALFGTCRGTRLSNALIAQANGFTTYDGPVEGSMVNYENRTIT